MKQLHLFVNNEEPVNKEHLNIKIDPNPYLGDASPHMGYREYIKSKDWMCKRRYALHYQNHHCQHCGSTKNLEVHHKHYSSLYHERLDDVKVLCLSCHKKADSQREYSSAFVTWAEKVYGEDWYKYDEMSLCDEFDEWLKWKEIESDYY